MIKKLCYIMILVANKNNITIYLVISQQYLSSFGGNSLTNEIFPMVLFLTSIFPFDLMKQIFRKITESSVVVITTSTLEPQPL